LPRGDTPVRWDPAQGLTIDRRCTWMTIAEARRRVACGRRLTT
jgi:hypothetical protein